MLGEASQARKFSFILVVAFAFFVHLGAEAANSTSSTTTTSSASEGWLAGELAGVEGWLSGASSSTSSPSAQVIADTSDPPFGPSSSSSSTSSTQEAATAAARTTPTPTTLRGTTAAAAAAVSSTAPGTTPGASTDETSPLAADWKDPLQNVVDKQLNNTGLRHPSYWTKPFCNGRVKPGDNVTSEVNLIGRVACQSEMSSMVGVCFHVDLGNSHDNYGYCGDTFEPPSFCGPKRLKFIFCEELYMDRPRALLNTSLTGHASEQALAHQAGANLGEKLGSSAEEIEGLKSGLSGIFDGITKLEQGRAQLVNERAQQQHAEAQLLQYKREEMRKRQNRDFLLSDLALENNYQRVRHGPETDDGMSPWTVASLAGLVLAVFAGVLIGFCCRPAKRAREPLLFSDAVTDARFSEMPMGAATAARE